MLRKFLLCILLLICSSYSFAAAKSTNVYCPQAQPTNSPAFCGSFRTAAECHCVSSGLPRQMCQDMKLLYDRMISMFGSLQKACEYQHDTDTQTCIDDWNCFRLGGKDSKGRLCSNTGNKCP